MPVLPTWRHFQLANNRQNVIQIIITEKIVCSLKVTKRYESISNKHIQSCLFLHSLKK